MPDNTEQAIEASSEATETATPASLPVPSPGPASVFPARLDSLAERARAYVEAASSANTSRA